MILHILFIYLLDLSLLLYCQFHTFFTKGFIKSLGWFLGVALFLSVCTVLFNNLFDDFISDVEGVSRGGVHSFLLSMIYFGLVKI